LSALRARKSTKRPPVGGGRLPPKGSCGTLCRRKSELTREVFDDMASRDALPDLKMDPAKLYREEMYTDRKIGTIRCMIPVKSDGAQDSARKVQYFGQTQLLTPVGALPISFEIEAASLAEAVEKFAAAAKGGIERAMKEIQEMRREAASSLIIPEAGAAGLAGPGGLPGGGKIKLP
jgi:hypothetical protein